MLEKLRQRQHQIRDAARQCHGDTTDLSSDGSAFSEKSRQVQSELQCHIDAVSSLITRLNDMNQQHVLVNRIHDDLAAWLETMNADVRRLSSRPAKLHIVAAELEIRQLEVNPVIIITDEINLDKFVVI